MQVNSTIQSSIDDRPFLFIGAVEAQYAQRFGCILDVILAQPARWHSAWLGRAVYGIALTPASQQCQVIQAWSSDRALSTHCVAVGQGRENDVNAWGALLIDHEKNSLRLARECLDRGIPVIGINFDSLETVEVTNHDLKKWLLSFDDTRPGDGSVEMPGFSTNDEQFKDDKSPFLVNSVTLPRDTHVNSSLAARNGERCGFSRSQAEKVG